MPARTDTETNALNLAKAASLRFQQSTPPRAEIEISGIATDRTYGSRGRPIAKPVAAAKPTTDEDPEEAKKDGKEALRTTVIDPRGRLQWKDDEIREKNAELLRKPPAPPETYQYIPNFTGHWICSGATGEWDEFLYLLGVPEFERKIARARKWGTGHEQQLISMNHAKTTISISNVSPPVHLVIAPNGDLSQMVKVSEPEEGADASFNLKNPHKSRRRISFQSADENEPKSSVSFAINGKEQEMTYGSVKGQGIIAWEGKALTTRMKIAGHDVRATFRPSLWMP